MPVAVDDMHPCTALMVSVIACQEKTADECENNEYGKALEKAPRPQAVLSECNVHLEKGQFDVSILSQNKRSRYTHNIVMMISGFVFGF